MVARIRTGKTIARVLQYNEQKVREQKGELMEAVNFLKAAETLSHGEKMGLFKKLMSLNERTTTNALHVSLNFDPSENLSSEKLLAIAKTYMNGIGFGDQPFLVYRHDDAGHPHIHIVSTNIRWDGSRISMHNLGRTKSEVARKEIEQQFGLAPAEHSRKKALNILESGGIAAYGKETTKGAISRTLSLAIGKYKPSSLAELKAILGLYQVAVLESKKLTKDNRVGLSFQVTDQLGKPISAPIKASRLPTRPTMKNLELVFEKNLLIKAKVKSKLESRIMQLIPGEQGLSWQALESRLNRVGVSLRTTQTGKGEMSELLFIDHRSGAVFKDGELQIAEMLKNQLTASQPGRIETDKAIREDKSNHLAKASATSSLASAEKHDTIPVDNSVPYPLKKTRKKKRKRIQR